jgi:hypothetical protein
MLEFAQCQAPAEMAHARHHRLWQVLAELALVLSLSDH